MPKVSINQRLAHIGNKARNTRLGETRAFGDEIAALSKLLTMALHHVSEGDPVGASYRFRQIAGLSNNAAVQLEHVALTFGATMGAGVDMMSRRTPRARAKIAAHLHTADAQKKAKAQQKKQLTLKHQKQALANVRWATAEGKRLEKNSGSR